ncbi:MAG: SH3 domain-containing protein, partial [Longimicrobiales bacterium]
ESGEALFALPVPLVTVSRSNVRTGPGTDHAVEDTLEPETAVTGMSYTSEWVRVAFGDGKEGWIFHTLVAKENGQP